MKLKVIRLLLLTTALMLLVGCGGISESDAEATVEAKVKAVLTAIPTPTAVANKKTYVELYLVWHEGCHLEKDELHTTGTLESVSTDWESSTISLRAELDRLKVEVPDGGAYRGLFKTRGWSWDLTYHVGAGKTTSWGMSCSS